MWFNGCCADVILLWIEFINAKCKCKKGQEKRTGSNDIFKHWMQWLTHTTNCFAVLYVSWCSKERDQIQHACVYVWLVVYNFKSNANGELHVRSTHTRASNNSFHLNYPFNCFLYLCTLFYTIKVFAYACQLFWLEMYLCDKK